MLIFEILIIFEISIIQEIIILIYYRMKTTVLVVKNGKFPLNDDSSYNKELDNSITDVVSNYKALLIGYLNFVNENVKLQNRNYFTYIMVRGVDTITYVFTAVLLYTKQLEVAYYYAEKSIYLYCEFINQIAEIDKHFLQLSSRDAAIYVYKKTIFDISVDRRKKSEDCSLETRDKFDVITANTNMLKALFIKLLNDEMSNIETITNMVNTVGIK